MISALHRYLLAAVAAVALAFLVAWAVQSNRLDSAKHEARKWESAASEWNRAADAWQTAASAIDADRQRTQRIVNRQAENLDHAQKQTDAAGRDAVAARSELDRLLDRATAAWSATCHRDPDAAATAASSGPAAGAPADLPADVLRRTGEAENQLAAFAEASHTAGQLCASNYDAISKP